MKPIYYAARRCDWHSPVWTPPYWIITNNRPGDCVTCMNRRMRTLRQEINSLKDEAEKISKGLKGVGRPIKHV